MKKTKILATIGPVSYSKNILKKMIAAGMDAIRINLSHGNIERHEKIINNVRAIKDIPIIFDTQGPEIRIITDREFSINKGDKIAIGFDKTLEFRFNKKLDLIKNQLVLVNEGILKLKVVSNNPVELVALNSGLIGKRARVNIPSMVNDFDILSDKDKEYIKYGLKKKIDYVAVSYARNKSDIDNVRKHLGSKMGIIAKIENSEAVKNFNEILAASDGIMIARGDLGVEIKSEKLPVIQKNIIRKCNQAAKFVITATQMLESMINNSRPTRAETSDVANAILDGTDLVMLSGETAIGKYPVLAIKEMARIAKEVESYTKNNVVIDSCTNVSEAISKSIFEMIKVLPITKIVTLTRSGYTARIISRFRLDVDILAVTPKDSVRKKLELYYGVKPIVFQHMPTRERILRCIDLLHKKRLIKPKDLVLITAGVYATKSGSTNLIEVHEAKELMRKK